MCSYCHCDQVVIKSWPFRFCFPSYRRTPLHNRQQEEGQRRGRGRRGAAADPPAGAGEGLRPRGVLLETPAGSARGGERHVLGGWRGHARGCRTRDAEAAQGVKGAAPGKNIMAGRDETAVSFLWLRFCGDNLAPGVVGDRRGVFGGRGRKGGGPSV